MCQVDARLAAVVVGWNHYEDSQACVRSILDAGVPGLHLWFVDNGSTDGTPTLLRQAFPGISVLEFGENRGLVAGYNAGIRAALEAGCDLICIFNNDLIVQQHAFQALAAATRDSSQAGIWTPKIVLHSDPQTIWSAGARWRRFPPGIVQRGMGARAETTFTAREYVGYATSCAWMMSAEMVRDIGLFAPEFSFYYSDYEYCRRAVDRGWRIVFVPDAVIEHKVSLSTRKASRPAQWWRNLGEAEVAYFRKYESDTLLVLHATWIILRALLQGDAGLIRPYIAGLRAGLCR